EVQVFIVAELVDGEIKLAGVVGGEPVVVVDVVGVDVVVPGVLPAGGGEVARRRRGGGRRIAGLVYEAVESVVRVVAEELVHVDVVGRVGQELDRPDVFRGGAGVGGRGDAVVAVGDAIAGVVAEQLDVG